MSISSDSPSPLDEEFIAAATFGFADEAAVACGLLDSGDVLFYLENEHTLTMVWPWSVALRGFRLMVPAAVAEEVRTMLGEAMVEEPLSAANEGLAKGRTGAFVRMMLVVAILCAPALDTLQLLYVWR